MSDHHYVYDSGEQVWMDAYIAPRIVAELRALGKHLCVLDAGCGNGHFTARLAEEGFRTIGFDSSESGIAHAQATHPEIRFEVATAYEDLRARFDTEFDACVCIEVIEHLFDPRLFVKRILDVLRPGGVFVVSTPYHGYVKNLALAATGRLDGHYGALWDGGHIKFWSRKTLTQLLGEAGFEVLRFQGAGRLPLLWKSMVITARKPG
ncbi:MAG: methyltransferase domain-containing protein [Chloroflexi bacterium]|nr:methyltransferase domain-containing protein [Chloroflexota bacterium]MBV9133040.1 methyltransferase domain-containing protein [Chloroflexota bacterium]MBV9892936.1 methyltransferase domain-containing protein [Chloroflexota bacterium]